MYIYIYMYMFTYMYAPSACMERAFMWSDVWQRAVSKSVKR